jgi:hypothetical protein
MNSVASTWREIHARPDARAGLGFWPKTMQWLVFSALPMGLLAWLQPWLMSFWQWLFTAWSPVLALSVSTRLNADRSAIAWTALADGSFAPSNASLLWSLSAIAALWLASAFFSDRFRPLRTSLRALCLIHLSACVFFIWMPASFPYSISKHLQAQMEMGYCFMWVTPAMLALGWSLFKVPVYQKLLFPCLVLAYFALMLPHKLLLQAWMLEHWSILFMPMLFLCFGSLLDLWIFVAVYAWLASRVPAQAAKLQGA